MTFDEILAQVRELLQSKGRVAYRALKRRFELDDEYLEDLKAELIDAEHVAHDEDGKVLVWAQEQEAKSREYGEKHEKEARSSSQSDSLAPRSLLPASQSPASERRQLTVMFIDLVGSTTLSQQLDPEDYHARVVTYQTACQQIITRYEGHIAQYLGDGVLVYFGYPAAHEEDAARAVRAGLEIISAMQRLSFPSPLAGEPVLPAPVPQAQVSLVEGGQGEGAAHTTRSLQVRIGIHTGPVVVGEIGAGEHTERLALGETPNIAARVQGMAEPDTVVVSAATYRLIHGLFECQDLGPQTLKGISTPLTLYRVNAESAAQSRFEVAIQTGLTPFIGREPEMAVLQQHWEQARAGDGQVVLLSGEPGIGKSRLVQEFKEQLGREGVTRLEFRCSPYHQNSALYPIIDHLQRLLQFTREDTPEDKLKKLAAARVGAQHAAPLPSDTIPLLAALLSLPHPEGSPPITVSPQKQKEKTQAALVAWLIEEAAQNTVYNAWEDLHWADPSTLEVLTLLLDQIPTTRLLAVLTFRPEFTPPWGNRSHLSQLTLSRLGRAHVETMIENVTRGKSLPADVLQQIVSKTDGVPLFVEELTKSVVEQNVGAYSNTPLLGIPITLQDALMARLDRLGTTKDLAQLGATLGREFNYELLHAVSPLDEGGLQQGLRQLVEVELLYQRGLPPQATYLFKHALIQDTAYQSLLKSKRQHYHQQIAHVLDAQFPDIKETQPELLAHHYTEAGLAEQSIPYWQKSGQKASQRSANVEAITHLTRGLEVLKTLPNTPEHIQQEIMLQIALGAPMRATRVWSDPELGETYARALELCRQVGETPQLFLVLMGLFSFYEMRGELRTAREIADQLLSQAQNMRDPTCLLWAHYMRGDLLFWLGEFASAQADVEQGLTFYNPQIHHSLALHYGIDPTMICNCIAGLSLWHLGHPDQALQRIRQALTFSQELAHPITLVAALQFAAFLHQLRREGQLAQERAEATLTLATDQESPMFSALGAIFRGWALAEQSPLADEQGKAQEGISQIHQGMTSWQASGAEVRQASFRVLLGEAYGKVGQVEEGLTVLDKALEITHNTGERYYEAELYRLKGELTLQSSVRSLESRVKEAEECFLKAIEVAQRQQAKSLELRAVMSLVRLRQHQALKHGAGSTEQGARSKESGVSGKEEEAYTRLAEAHKMLSKIYNWFTEGFDTLDLKEAKALLESLESGV